MAKKQNKISINKLEKHCEMMAPVIIDKSFNISAEETIQYQIKPRLSLEECIRFVNNVVNECVRPNDEIIIPMARKFITYRGVLTYYGNFKMPEDISKTFDLVMGAHDIISEILESIDQDQYKMLLSAIDEGIEFEKQKILSAQEQRTSEVIAQVNQFMARMSSLFEGVDAEQMSDFISGVSKMPNVTAEDLASAIVQKTNSEG